MLLWRMARVLMLTSMLLTCSADGLLLWSDVCCSWAPMWVSNLRAPNGPVMQLLVLVLRFLMMLWALDPVASTMTGMLDLVCRLWYMLMLLCLGSTRLSSIRLGPAC